jgi:hypothetical protein
MPSGALGHRQKQLAETRQCSGKVNGGNIQKVYTATNGGALNMKIRPLQDRVIIKRFAEETKSAGARDLVELHRARVVSLRDQRK